VTWMMDLGRISLDGHDLGKQDDFLRGLQGSYPMRTIDTLQGHGHCSLFSQCLTQLCTRSLVGGLGM
jgi:hypothetical protein